MSNPYAVEASSRSTKNQLTPATNAIRGRESEMGSNNNGGVSFLLDDWGVFERFLFIGITNGTYSPDIKGVSAVTACFDLIKTLAATDAKLLVDRITEVSTSGRAPKNDPAVVALAVAATLPESAQLAFGALKQVCRTGTHLFQFIGIYNELGKWNAVAKRAVSDWYEARGDNSLATQLLKYQSRNGWSHRDVLRLAHIKPSTPTRSAMYRHAVKGEFTKGLPELYDVVRTLNRGDLNPAQVVNLIADNKALSWEMVPTKYLSDVSVLSALLPTMGLTALIRKLGVMTTHGVFSSTSNSRIAAEKIANAIELHKQRVHPITIYAAFKQYRSGAGNRGGSTWSPDSRIVTALDDAFYAAFKPSRKTDNLHLVGVDISGSMLGATVLGMNNITADEVAVIMAMAAVREQEHAEIVGFNKRLVKLDITPDMTLAAAGDKYRRKRWDGGATDAGKLIEYAAAISNVNVDTFVIITDNDINSGKQPSTLLTKYRKDRGVDSRLAVIATALSNFTVADPKDPLSINIAGFDSAAPSIIANL